jgi:hypothetical protein
VRLRVCLAALVALLAAAPVAGAQSWNGRVADAARYVESRSGVESFAVVDEEGRLRGYRVRMRAPSASLLKAMALVGYLRLPSVRGRALTDSERRLLGPMIRRSDNAAAGAVLRTVGSQRLYHLARRARMLDFSFAWPIWGRSTTSARDQALFFSRITRYVPRRHRGYTLFVLATIVPSQRWGIPPAAPPRWTVHFKGGWGSGTGLVAHQSALLRRDGRRLALSVITRWNPSHGYGTTTIQGVASRLLERPLPPVP